MCLSREERQKRKLLRNVEYLYHRLHERGSALFGNVSPRDMLLECFNAFDDPQKSVIIEDGRGDKSTHHCVFISDAGGYVCLPCNISDEGVIVCTIKNIREDERPNWYVRNYNDRAQERSMPRMNFVVGQENT